MFGDGRFMNRRRSFESYIVNMRRIRFFSEFVLNLLQLLNLHRCRFCEELKLLGELCCCCTDVEVRWKLLSDAEVDCCIMEEDKVSSVS